MLSSAATPPDERRARLRDLARRIRRVKEALATVGLMRPGSLTRPYKGPKGPRGAYRQISYTPAMKSHTESVRHDRVADICRQIAADRRFTTLTEQWIDVSIEASTLQVQLAQQVGSE
jgi:hypothetical protein